MTLQIQITTGSPVPIYQQIVNQIRTAILQNELSVGEKLPSVRGLAEQLVINHNTVAKAYSELTRDGLVESQQGRGLFVTRKRQVYTKRERTRRLQLALERFVHEALQLDFSREELLEAVGSRLDEFLPASANRKDQVSHDD